MINKKLLNILLVLTVFCVFSFHVSFADENMNADVTIAGDHNPSISRFNAFDAMIPIPVASKLYRYSLKLYINGTDRSLYLQSYDIKDGSIYVSYDPIKELPTGQVNIVIRAVGKDDKTYSHKFSFVVNPGADKALAPYYRATISSPSNVSAHINFAKAYENKQLFKDAAYEYRKALTYSPRDKTALEGWKRVFTSLDRKSITINNVTLDAAIDEGVDKLGNLIIFKVRIINNSHEIVKFNTADTLLIVDNDYQIRPVENLLEYPEKAAADGKIGAEQFARIKYYLDSKSEKNLLKPIVTIDLQPSIPTEGYIAYELKYPEYKYLNLWIKVKMDPKIKITFRLPFKKP